jgi:hypothetical protein
VSTLAIVVVAVVAVLAVLALLGAVANARRRSAGRAEFQASLEEVNRALAVAHAEDKGWEPNALDAAARRAFEAQRPGATIRQQSLVQVIDRPGTDEDKAVFHFLTDEGETYLTLGRSGGEWVAEGVEG